MSVGVVIETFNNEKFHNKIVKAFTSKEKFRSVAINGSYQTHLKIDISKLDDIQDQIIAFHEKCLKKNGPTDISYDNCTVIIVTKYGNVIINFIETINKPNELSEIDNLIIDLETENLLSEMPQN
jgi:hypothetical protein